MKSATLILAALALFLSGVGRAEASTLVYDLPGPGNFIDQQNGNNMYYYGDDVTLAPGTPRHLDSVTMTFSLYTNDGTGSYTPNLSLDIFSIDPITRLPTGGSLGTASVDNVSFLGGNFDPLTPLTLQDVTFDFTSQNVILPDNFAFAYHDNVDPSNLIAQGFSVVGADPSTATVGSTVNGFLDAYPNDPSNDAFQFGVNGEIPGDTATGNLLATIDASAVPEPATLALLGIGIAGLAGYGWRRRKLATV